MNWGNKLLIAILLFIGMMGYLVYRSVSTRYELVSETYYNDELAYQQTIDGASRAYLLSALPTVMRADKQIEIRLPEEMKGTATTGTIHFYCPVDAAKDKLFPLQTDTSGLQFLPSTDVTAGKYIIKIRWEKDRQHYYAEQNFELTP